MSVADSPVLTEPPAAASAPASASLAVLGGRVARAIGTAALVSLPGLLTLYLSFNSGGYFPGATAVAVAVLAGGVVIRMALARDALAGLSRPLVAVVAGLAAYSLWSLISAAWSHSPSRALLAFDLANVYLFAVILFGSAARSDRRVRWMVGLTWAAMLAVCGAALATRLRPDLFPIPVNLSPERLAFPLTYWNALGMFAVLGLAFSTYSASSVLQSPLVRVLAAASIPVFSVTILLTYSRAAVALAPAVLLAYALLARPRGMPSALVAAAPTSAVAVVTAYHAGLISNGLTTPAAVHQGRHVLSTLLLACGVAAVIRVVLLALDARLGRIRVAPRAARTGKSVAALVLVGAALFGGLTARGQISHEWKSLVGQNASGGDSRSHLISYNLNDRMAGWRIAMRVFNANPVRGSGADTFELAWERQRTNEMMATETHSLYLQAMSELGIVGLVALAVPLLVLIGTALARARRSSRSLWVALAVAGGAWAVHAGMDWDWQMPAVSLPVFALLACGLARRSGPRRLGTRTEFALRVVVGVAAVAVAVTALRIAVSDTNLTSSVNSYNSADCQSAIPEAHSAIAAVASRPQPYAVLGFCDLKHPGGAGAAVAAMRAAQTRDPANWRYHYDLAIAQAADGQNPTPQLRAARALNPMEPEPAAELAAFTHHPRRAWRRLAASAQRPVELRQ